MYRAHQLPPGYYTRNDSCSPAAGTAANSYAQQRVLFRLVLRSAGGSARRV